MLKSYIVKFSVSGLSALHGLKELNISLSQGSEGDCDDVGSFSDQLSCAPTTENGAAIQQSLL